MRRTRKTVAVLCIALVALAAFLPAATDLAYAILVPLWAIVPAIAAVIIRREAVRCDLQTVSLFSLVPPRAPPAAFVPA